MPNARIIIADDEPIIVADLESCLRRMGYEVIATPDNGHDTVREAFVHRPDLVLLDIVLGGGPDGIAIASQLQGELEIPVVFVTSHGDEHTVQRARETAPFGYVLKPFEPRALQASIEIALHRARCEAEHRNVGRWLATTLRSIADAVIATDCKGRITFLNPAAEKLVGWRSSDALGRKFSEIFQARYESTGLPVPTQPEDVIADGETEFLGDNIVLRTRKGGEVCIEQTVSPVRDEDGTVTGTVVVFRDCTVRKRAEKEMRQAQAEIRRTNETLLRKHEELQSFYHTVSHEIKTPLTAAREFVSLVAEGLAGPVTETQVEYLKTAQESCDQMRVSINDLLDSTRLDTGKLSLQRQDAPLNPVIERVVSMLAPATAQKGITLDWQAQPDLPDVLIDENRVAQILTNLINNAIKFTPPGGRITVSATHVTAPRSCLQIAVTDTGCGIAPDHQSRIFDRLYQVRGEDLSQGKGLGLGLHICQELVRLHDGKIWVNSEVGRGSTFYFTIPVGQDRATRILVADGEPDSCEHIRASLEPAGYTVVTALDSHEAIRLMEARPADLAIVDLMMPGLGGPGTIQGLRAFQRTLPIIVQNSTHDRDALTRALRHGPVTLLAKPSEPKCLLETVGRLIECSRKAA